MSVLATTRFQTLFETGANVPFRMKLYIADDNDELVDFSDRAEIDGKNLLKNVGALSYLNEKQDGTGLTFTKAISITLDNSDRFFDKPFSSLTTIKGNAASFSSTQNGKKTNLWNRNVTIAVQVTHEDGAPEELYVASFLAGRLKTSFSSPNASLSLREKSLPMRAQDSAGRVKNGRSYWQNRPIPFLIEECLKIRYAKADGTLPASFTIPKTVEIESAASQKGQAGDVRVLSHFGRPPERDQNSVWLNKSLFGRAIAVGVGPTDLSSDSSPSSTTATKKHVYLGLDNELWHRDPDTELSTLLGSTPTGIPIQRLWYSEHQRKVYGIAYPAPAGTLRTVNARLFSYDGTTFTSMQTLNTIFPGDFCYRDGRQTGGVDVEIGQRLTDSGEQVAIPHTQSIQAMHNDAFFVYEVTNIGTGGTATLLGRLMPGNTFTVEAGKFYAFNDANTVSTVNPPANLRWSLGQRGFFVLNSRAANNVFFWYATYDLGSEDISIKKINLQTNSITTMLSSLEVSSGKRIDPTCGCPDLDSDEIYLGGIYWDDDVGSSPNVSQGVIYKMSSIPLTAPTKLYNATDYAAAQQYFTPLDIAHDNSNNVLMLSMFARDRADKSDSFIFAEHGDSSNADVTVKNKGPKSMLGLEFDPDDNVVYGYEIGSGRVRYWDASNSALISIDDGFHAVDNEYGLASRGLALDRETRSGSLSAIVYGISSPVPLPFEAYAVIANAKLYLFKADKFYSGRVPLFKTEGKTLFEAIELLAHMADYKPGFTKQGDFYFVERAYETASDVTVELDEVTNKNLINIERDSGEGEVYNFVQAIPFSVFLGPPEVELRLVSRPEVEEGDGQTALEEKIFDSEILVQQKDALNKSVLIECVSGGLISDGKVKMRYRSVDERFETRLSAAYTAGGTTLTIPTGIDSVRAGDTVEVSGSGNSEPATVDKDPSAAEIEAGTMTIDAAFANNYAIGAFVEITKNESEWSDEKQNELDDGFFQDYDSGDLVDWSASDGNISASEDSTAGNYLFGKSTAKLSLTGGTDSYYQQTIAVADLDANSKYTVTGRMRCFAGDASDNRCDEMELKVTETGGDAIEADVTDSTKSLDFAIVSVTFRTKAVPTGSVQIQLHVKGTANTHGWVDGFVMKKGPAAELDLILLSNNTLIPIGRTNIEVKFTPQQNETKMLAGDEIIVRCPGLDLQKEESSLQTAINTSSREEYGEIPFPRKIENPLLGPSLARDIARRTLNEHAWPKAPLRVIIPLRPHLDHITANGKITTVTVRSRELFQQSGGWAERCRLRGITDDYRSQSTTLELKAIERD